MGMMLTRLSGGWLCVPRIVALVVGMNAMQEVDIAGTKPTKRKRQLESQGDQQRSKTTHTGSGKSKGKGSADKPKGECKHRCANKLTCAHACCKRSISAEQQPEPMIEQHRPTQSLSGYRDIVSCYGSAARSDSKPASHHPSPHPSDRFTSAAAAAPSPATPTDYFGLGQTPPQARMNHSDLYQLQNRGCARAFAFVFRVRSVYADLLWLFVFTCGVFAGPCECFPVLVYLLKAKLTRVTPLPTTANLSLWKRAH
jgi:hypothetical protein